MKTSDFCGSYHPKTKPDTQPSTLPYVCVRKGGINENKQKMENKAENIERNNLKKKKHRQEKNSPGLGFICVDVGESKKAMEQKMYRLKSYKKNLTGTRNALE